MDRRRFFTSSAALAAATFQSDALLRAQRASDAVSGRAADTVARDEDFWFSVRHAFTVDRNMINLNNGGVSPAPKIVMDTEIRYLEIENLNPSYYMWNVLDPGVETVRRRLAETFGCDIEEIAITRNASEGLEIIQLGMDLKPGDEVLTTNQDYPRMITTWQQRERRDGIVLKQITFPVPPPSLDYLTKRIESHITPKTKVIHICHITNRTGQIFPIKSICQMARERGIEVVVDGAHAFAQFPFRRDDLDCDYYATSLHKWVLAPIGTGMLYVRKSKIAKIWPMMAAPDSMRDNIRKFEEIGTHPASQRDAITEALNFHDSIGPERKAERFRYLRKRWSNRLRDLPGVKILNSEDPEQSCAIGFISIDGFDAPTSSKYLWEKERIWTVAVVTPGEYQGLRITPNIYRNALQFNLRVDKYWSKDRLYGNFFRTTLNTGGPVARPAFASTNTYNSNSAQVNETHTFTPTTINEASFAFLRIEGQTPSSGNFQVPAVTVNGVNQGFGTGFALGDYVQHSYHWRDVFTQVRSTHSFKLGYEGWHGDDLAFFAPVHDQPNFTFNNLLDLVEDNPYSETNLAYNPLTGQPKPGNYGFTNTMGGAFAQDTWNVKPNLTFNYGLRWDTYGNPYPSLQGTILANFFLGPGTTFGQQVARGSMQQLNHVLNQSLANVLSPRGGVAWDPWKNGNWVVRGGFGLYHDMPTLGNLENGLNSNPPGYIVPTFYNNGTTSAPIFALGTSNTPPFGFPYPALGATGLNAQGGLVGVQSNVGGVDPNLTSPTTMNYAATIEHRLFESVVASVGYQGSHTYNEFWG